MAEVPHPAQRATAWPLTPTAVSSSRPRRTRCKTESAWMLACRTVPQPGYPRTPCSVAAPRSWSPKDGTTSPSPGPRQPAGLSRPTRLPCGSGARVQSQPRRSTPAAAPSPFTPPSRAPPPRPSPGPLRRSPRLGGPPDRRYFADFAHTPAGTWDDVIKAMSEPGPDTRGVNWVRREIGGQRRRATSLRPQQHGQGGVPRQPDLVPGPPGNVPRPRTDLLRAVPTPPGAS